MTTAPRTPNKIGSALISNTLVCEVSRLVIEDPANIEPWTAYREGTEAWRLYDLMSLIEAVTLHENIFTLPARLSSDVDDLELRKALIRSEVLIELDTKPFHKAVGNAIVRSLEQVKDPVRVIGMTKDSSESIAFEGETKSEVQDFLLLSSQVKSDSQTTSPEFKPLATGLSLNDSYDYYGPNRSSHDILSASSFQKMGKSLIGWIESNGSGAYDHCTSILRDMYYNNFFPE